MQIFRDIHKPALIGPTYLTIGNLDGMHRGHQQLFHTIAALAQQSSKPNIGLLTFAPHPLVLLRPEHPLQLLTTPQERIKTAGNHGANFGIICPFTPEIAAMRAVEFMAALTQNYGLTHLVVGPDFALGHGRSGNIDRLHEIGQELGYTLTVLEPVAWQNKPVRSSIIRKILQTGDVAEAAQLLGRPYCISGTVIEGDKRGRTIGVPTANLQVDENRLWPLDGVYATRATIHTTSTKKNSIKKSNLEKNKQPTTAKNQTFDSVTNLGIRPTVNGTEQRFETHLLDFPPINDHGVHEDDDLYGKTLSVEFIERLRGEQRFDGLDALTNQIQRDIQQARTILAAYRLKEQE